MPLQRPQLQPGPWAAHGRMHWLNCRQVWLLVLDKGRSVSWATCAHTSVLADTRVESMGVMVGPKGGCPKKRSLYIEAHTWASRDTARPCAVGQQLVDLCVATRCVIRYCRAGGDEEARPTFVGYDGLVTSVIDCGVGSRSMWPFIRGLWLPPIMGSLTTTSCQWWADTSRQGGTPALAVVKRDPELREQYRLLHTDEYS